MKALSLTQPMAWAIFHGKPIENRNWNTHFRGRFMVHASKKFNQDHYDFLLDNWVKLGLKMKEIPKPGEFVQGALIGEADLVSVVEMHGSLWFFGPYGFILRKPSGYKKPIPCKGELGFFTPKL